MVKKVQSQKKPTVNSDSSTKASSITIGSGVELKGEISNAKEVTIDGIADVKVSTQKIIVGEKGVVQGNVEAVDAQIRGELTGDIKVSNTLTIHDRGSISGKIAYKMLDIKLGGIIKGEISAIDDRPASVKSPSITPSAISSDASTKKNSNANESLIDIADKITSKK